MDVKKRKGWLRSQVAKRELSWPTYHPHQYDVGGNKREELIKDAHENGIDQVVNELVSPLLLESEKLRENAKILVEYLDREYSQGRFSRVTKYGRAVEALRNIITDQRN